MPKYSLDNINAYNLLHYVSKMFKRIAVGDIMTRNFVSVRPNDSLLRCAKEFVRQKVTSLLVTDKNRLFGILTERNILWTLTKNPSIDLSKIKAIDVATRKVAVIKPSADITHAFKKMKHYGFRRLPVISKGIVVGLLTLKDILTIEPLFYSESTDLFEIREEERKLKTAAKGLSTREGICDECGSSEELLKFEGRYLCYDCRDLLY